MISSQSGDDMGIGRGMFISRRRRGGGGVRRGEGISLLDLALLLGPPLIYDDGAHCIALLFTTTKKNIMIVAKLT
jgi:hypothetical protein